MTYIFLYIIGVSTPQHSTCSSQYLMRTLANSEDQIKLPHKGHKDLKGAAGLFLNNFIPNIYCCKMYLFQYLLD